MNAIELIEILENSLKSDITLKGINITTDPYSRIETMLPCILIDNARTYLKTASHGETIGYFHDIDFFVFVSAHNRKHAEYRKEAAEIAVKLLKVLNSLQSTDYRMIMREREDEMTPQELTIGSTKCSSILVTKQYETNI